MLMLLDKKLDKVLDLMNLKADITEVVKLRERMHKIEGAQGAVSWITEEMHEIKGEVKTLSNKVEHLETTQVTETSVRKALEEQRKDQRATIMWVAGFLGSLGVLNFVVNLTQGG